MKVLLCSFLLLALCLLNVSSQPAFERQTYNVTDSEGVVCATYELAAQFLPEYLKNNTETPVTQEINLPSVDYKPWNVRTDRSKCPDREFGISELVVDFGDQNSFTLMTMSNDSLPAGVNSNSNWTVTLIQLQFNKADSNLFPETRDSGLVTVSVANPGIGTDGNQGGLFKCNAAAGYKLVNGETQVDMELKDLLLNPYNDPEGEVPTECAADTQTSSSDDKIVPIAVGCALGGLLIIVLIAFLIGRRSRRSGYKQV